MKAVLCTAYGPPSVMKVSTLPRPVPRAREVLIKVHATAITPGDCEIRTLKMHPSMYPLFRLALGIRKPRNPVLGMYFSGTVVEAGSDSKRLDIGAEVFGCTGFAMGTNAEYLRVAETACVIPKPVNLTHSQAAAVPIGALNAIHFCHKANLKESEKMLIVGAGGAIGTFAIQLAKLKGLQVTAIDSALKLDMLKHLGADHVLDYELTDFTEAAEKYDVIFDVVGKTAYSRTLNCLTKDGRYLLANVGVTPMLRGAWTSRVSDKRVISAMAGEKREELEEIKKLIEESKLHPVVDRVFSLEQIPEAHSYIDSGQRQGNVVASFVD